MIFQVLQHITPVAVVEPITELIVLVMVVQLLVMVVLAVVAKAVVVNLMAKQILDLVMVLQEHQILEAVAEVVHIFRHLLQVVQVETVVLVLLLSDILFNSK